MPEKSEAGTTGISQSNDPALTAGGLCGGYPVWGEPTIQQRLDAALEERERTRGRSPGCMTPGEAGDY